MTMKMTIYCFLEFVIYLFFIPNVFFSTDIFVRAEDISLYFLKFISTPLPYGHSRRLQTLPVSLMLRKKRGSGSLQTRFPWKAPVM